MTGPNDAARNERARHSERGAKAASSGAEGPSGPNDAARNERARHSERGAKAASSGAEGPSGPNDAARNERARHSERGAKAASSGAEGPSGPNDAARNERARHSERGNWRPLQDESSRIVGIGSSLEAVVKRLGGGSVKAQNTILENWPTAVGADVAQHAKPLSLVDGILTVEVDDAKWLTQLKWLGGRIADRLNEASSTELVERLNVRLTSPKRQNEEP